MPCKSTSIFSMPMPVNIIGTAFCSTVILDAAVVHSAGGQHAAHFLPRPLVPLRRVWAIGCCVEGRRRGGQHIQQPILGPPLGILADVLLLGLPHEADGIFHQFANHAFHVAAVVADLRVAGSPRP